MNQRKTIGVMELIEGILLLLMGFVTLFRPESALTGLVIVYGLVALLTGIVDVAFYIIMEKHTGFGPTISLVTGILSVLGGCLLMAHPEIGLQMMMIIFPIWFMTHCISRMSHLNVIRFVAGDVSYYLTLIASILGLLLGVWMLFSPGLSVLSMSVLLGTELILLGVDALSFAVLNLRRY